MVALKAHVTLGFWQGEMVTGATDLENDARGSFGKLTTLADFAPDEELTAMVRNACNLIDRGVVAHLRSERHRRIELPTPPRLQAALDANPEAKLHWDRFTASQRREYCEWVGDAGSDATVLIRLAQTIEWVAGWRETQLEYEDC